MKIRNLANSKGNFIKNQFVIENGDTIYFQSYDSTICRIDRAGGMGFDKIVTIGKDWNYSITTSKYFYTFLTQQGLEILASKEAIREALDRGYARLDQNVAVWFDKTL